MSNRVSINKLCRRCMCELDNEEAKCSTCGFERTMYNVPREHLRLDCILKGKYLVGICIGETENEKTYAGWNLGYDTKVVIKEYFPKKMLAREDHESGQTIIKKNAYQEAFKNNVNKYINQAELQSFNDQKKINITETFQENGTAYYIINCLAVDNQASKDEFDAAIAFEVIKPNEYESPSESQENVSNEFKRVNGNLGRTYIQPAFHVQPAKSNAAALSDEEAVVKNIATNVLPDAKVSYVKIMRPKSESLNMDLEAELEKSRQVEEEVRNTNATSTLTFDGNANEDNDVTEDKEEVTKEPSKIAVVKDFIEKNKTLTAIAIVAILFIIVGIKLISNNSDDGSDQITSQTAQSTTSDKPTAAPQATQEAEQEQESKEPEVPDEPFTFINPEGEIAATVINQIGKNVDDITVSDIESIKSLNLRNKGLKDEDIAELLNFTALESLDLSKNTDLTDISAVNGLSATLKYVNLIGCLELVEQLPDIDFVVGRKNEVTVRFHYNNPTSSYSDKAIWVWTANPGTQLEFEEADGTAIATNTYILYNDRHVGFKIKKSGKDDWSEVPNEWTEDRQFDLPCNKPGYCVDVYITQGQEAFNVKVNAEDATE